MPDDIEAEDIEGGSSSDDERRRLEALKLEREVENLALVKEKLDAELADAKRPYILRNSQLITTIIATLGAVIALGIALNKDYFGMLRTEATNAKRDADEEQRKADDERAKAQEEKRRALDEQAKAQQEIQNAQAAEHAARERADRARREAAAQELVAASISSLPEDPERSILLAMHAISQTWSQDRTAIPQAEAQLHTAILASRVRSTELHHSPVNSVAWSPDGRQIATADSDGMVRISQVQGGDVLHSLKADSGAVRSISWSRDGAQLATGGDDQVVKLWNAGSGTLVRLITERSGPIKALALSPDGKWLAACSDVLNIWSLPSLQKMKNGSLGEGKGSISLAWSRDGKRLAIGDIYRTTYIVDIDSGKLLHRLAGDDWVRSIAWSPDGTRLVTDNFFKATIWDAMSGAAIANLRGLRDYIFALAWSPDGTEIATGSESTRIWNAQSGDEVMRFSGDSEHVNTVAWSPDGTMILSGSNDTTARIWNAVPANTEYYPFQGGRSFEARLVWSRDGTKIATASGDLRVWDFHSGRLLLRIPVPDESNRSEYERFTTVRWGFDGRWVVAGLLPSSRLGKWNLDAREQPLFFATPSINLSDISLSPDSKHLVTVSSLQGVAIWDTSKGTLEADIPLGRTFLSTVEWSPDGSKFAIGSTDASLDNAVTGKPNVYQHATQIWDARARVKLEELPDHNVGALAWSSDSRELATAEDRVVRIWDVDNHRRVGELRGQRARILRVAWSPDGNHIATACADGTTGIWDIASRTEIMELSGHSNAATDVAWSDDGRHIASIGLDGVTQVFAMDISELMQIARSRATRELSPQECLRYLRTAKCPVLQGWK
jgi:WD40 repeat protein